MRILAVATLTLAALPIAAEAKPAADPLRSEAMAVCVREENADARRTPAFDPSEVCECALDQYLLGRRPEDLSTIVEGDTRALGQIRAECRRQLRDGVTRNPPDLSEERPARDGVGALLGRYWWIIAIASALTLLIVFARSRGRGDLLTPPPAAPRDDGDPPQD